MAHHRRCCFGLRLPEWTRHGEASVESGWPYRILSAKSFSFLPPRKKLTRTGQLGRRKKTALLVRGRCEGAQAVCVSTVQSPCPAYCTGWTPFLPFPIPACACMPSPQQDPRFSILVTCCGPHERVGREHQFEEGPAKNAHSLAVRC